MDNLDDLSVEFAIHLFGFPFGAHFMFMIACDGVQERFCERLPTWKGHYISEGGRLTLI